MGHAITTLPSGTEVPPVTAATGTVLVVEDDQAVSAALHLLLTHYGYEVEVAGTLAEARRALAGGGPGPGVIVLDLNLPDGSGLDLLEHVRSTHRRSRVAVLTADVDPAHLRRLKTLRPDRFFRKPLNFLDLLAAVRGEPAVAPAVAPAVPPSAAA